VHANEVAFAFGIQLQDRVAMRFGEFGAFQVRRTLLSIW
jgi:hypothetical protein